MRRFFPAGVGAFEILGKNDRVESFQDVHAARVFLRRMAETRLNMIVLRELYESREPRTYGCDLPDDDVLERLAHELAHGGLIMVSRQLDSLNLHPLPVKEVVESAPPPQPGQNPGPEPEEETPDEETLVASEDQAEVFENAAETGEPLCLA